MHPLPVGIDFLYSPWRLSKSHSRPALESKLLGWALYEPSSSALISFVTLRGSKSVILRASTRRANIIVQRVRNVTQRSVVMPLGKKHMLGTYSDLVGGMLNVRVMSWRLETGFVKPLVVTVIG
jgi:hypothetical protein